MSWWAVVIEGEELPDLLGPYRSQNRAIGVADDWNADHTGRAFVVPMVQDPRGLRS